MMMLVGGRGSTHTDLGRDERVTYIDSGTQRETEGGKRQARVGEARRGTQAGRQAGRQDKQPGSV